jgi:hypothetical protein
MVVNHIRPGHGDAKKYCAFVGLIAVPNTQAQAGRGSDVRLSTKARSRPCPQPAGWASQLPILLRAS